MNQKNNETDVASKEKKPGMEMLLSVDIIKKLKKYSVFNGEDGCPEPGVYRDTFYNAKGLRIRLSPWGKMTFVVHGRIAKKGKSAQYFTIGDARSVYLHTARDLAGDFRSYMAAGKNPVEEHKKNTKKYTLELFFHDYKKAKGTKSIHNRRGLKLETIIEYEKEFARLSKKIRTKDAQLITREDIIREHDRIALIHTDFMSDKTMHLVHALYSGAKKRYVNEAENTPIITMNPVEVLSLDRAWKVNSGQSRRKRECIDTDDLKDVLDALEKLEFYKDGIKFIHKTTSAAVVCSHFFRLLLFTGWRPEEASKMRWEQVSEDFKDVTWNDEEAVAKLKGGEAQYRFPLNSEATKVLQSIRKYNFKSEWVFPTNKMTTPISQNPTLYVDVLQKLINNNKRYTAGIYRKTFQTYAEECGISSNSIKRLVFHTQNYYDVQSGYIATNREAFRRMSQKVADFILLYADRFGKTKSESIEINSDLLIKATELAKKAELSRDEMINKLIEIGVKFETMK